MLKLYTVDSRGALTPDPKNREYKKTMDFWRDMKQHPDTFIPDAVYTLHEPRPELRAKKIETFLVEEVTGEEEINTGHPCDGVNSKPLFTETDNG